MSMEITDYFNVDRGLSIPSPGGTRRVTEAIDSYSQLYTDLVSNGDATKHCIDSCWESGNIYFATSDGYVKKIAFDGTVLASLELTNPVAVSVMQYASVMQTNVTYPPQDDKGCWIADNGTGKVLRTDKDLNVVAEYSGLTGVICLEADNDGGCFIAENSVGSILKIDSQANLISTKAFSTFTIPIQNVDRMSVDVNSRLYVLGNDTLFNLVIDNQGNFVQWVAIDILGSPYPFSSSSEDIEEIMHVGDMDIDRNSGTNQYVYVTGGNGLRAFVIRYSGQSFSAITETYYNTSFPYVIQVVQGIESSSLYLLSDPYKWDQYEYGSSSSSSSSSSIDSSSSSSSSSEA